MSSENDTDGIEYFCGYIYQMSFLNNAYFKYSRENKAWKNGFFSALVVLLIFLLFQPFGFRDKALGLKLVLYPGYAIIAFANTQIIILMARHKLKSKKLWFIKDEILSFIISTVLLALVIHLYTFLMVDDMPLTWRWYFKLLYHVASLYLIIGIMEYFYYSHKSARSFNQQLSSAYEKAQQALDDVRIEYISISLEKEQIEINRNKILCIQSTGNYLEFCLSEPDGKIRKIIKRGRLQAVENDLATYSEFSRCHRAYIVNLKQVTRLKGNIKNARIIITGMDDIPVSRSAYKSLKDQLEQVALS